MKWISLLVILLSSAAFYPLQIPAQKPIIVSTKVSQTKSTRPPKTPKSQSDRLPPINRPRRSLGDASISAPKSSENP